MLYKRSEYFRYTFGKPLDAKFRIVMGEAEEQKSKKGDCTLVDLSPGGAKLLAEFDIPFSRDAVNIQLEFTLYQAKIEVLGTLVWKESYQKDFLYGFDFEEDLEKEQLIVAELKLLRKSESSEKQ
ncbi:PilZ domain-containing protein [Sporosarcina siberiensis]|uniref:PilZ domain-containing protein n=1 Tax=Sporosarcina siberiensis TaxID=1365606 RepID=A0ABW4SBQ4_9BACL